MDILDIPENETDEAVLHTLEQIRRWKNILLMHQTETNPSALTIDQYTDLIEELTQNLVQLIEARYGLSFVLTASKMPQAA